MKTSSHRQTGRIPAALVLLGCTFSLSIAKADSMESLWEYSLDSAWQCQGAIIDSIKSATTCLLDDGINTLLDKSVVLANQQGKAMFGENFSLTGRMAWSPGIGSMGNLDMVTPFMSTDSSDPADIRSASFMQQGVTRWRDPSGTMRNDLRHGIVHRFRVGNGPNADLAGLSSFYLHSAEYGHQVLALGLEYFGRWGTGELRYFAPASGWTAVGAGREEKPLEGVELGASLNLTTTLDLSVTGYRWEREDGSGDWNRSARMGLNWRPHPWLSFDTTWDGGNHDAVIAGIQLNIPLDSVQTKKPRWEGFGIAGRSDAGKANPYQAVPQIGQIRVASRAASATSTSGGVSVRFVESSAHSGTSVNVEVSVAEPTQADLTVIVRLEPGKAAPAAVAGEDFVDEPVEAVIEKGTASTVVSIPLLHNDGMREARSLGVTASIAS